MINFDDYANENKTEHNKKVVIYSRSSKQNNYNRRFKIWKNKCIIEFNRKPTKHYKICLYVKDSYEVK